MDFISRQKRWEAEQARIAAESSDVLEDDEMAANGVEDGGLCPTKKLSLGADNALRYRYCGASAVTGRPGTTSPGLADGGPERARPSTGRVTYRVR